MLKSLFALAAASTLTLPSAAAVIQDFEGGTFVGSGGQNGGIVYNGSPSPGVNGATDFADVPSTAVAGLAGSATALRLDINGAGLSYAGAIDFDTQQLLNAGLDVTNAVLTFDYVLNNQSLATNQFGEYSNLTLIANTDGTDGNNYNQGNSFEFGGIAVGTSGTASIDFTGLVPLLNPAINPNYTSLRLSSNTSGGVLDVTVDNFAITVVPEPASLALLGLGGLAMLRRNRG